MLRTRNRWTLSRLVGERRIFNSVCGVLGLVRAYTGVVLKGGRRSWGNPEYLVHVTVDNAMTSYGDLYIALHPVKCEMVVAGGKGGDST